MVYPSTLPINLNFHFQLIQRDLSLVAQRRSPSSPTWSRVWRVLCTLICDAQGDRNLFFQKPQANPFANAHARLAPLRSASSAYGLRGWRLRR